MEPHLGPEVQNLTVGLRCALPSLEQQPFSLFAAAAFRTIIVVLIFKIANKAKYPEDRPTVILKKKQKQKLFGLFCFVLLFKIKTKRQLVILS